MENLKHKAALHIIDHHLSLSFEVPPNIIINSSSYYTDVTSVKIHLFTKLITYLSILSLIISLVSPVKPNAFHPG